MSHMTKRYAPPGTLPGELRAAAVTGSTPVRLHLVEYDATFWLEQTQATTGECRAQIQAPTHTWIHVQGTVTPEVLRELGTEFGIHALALEDVLNTEQRPKLESYGDALFAVLAVPSERQGRAVTEQLSVFFDRGVIISFHNGASDPLEPVRQRMREPGGRLRTHAPDYLFYALIDLAIDKGFPALDALAQRIEALEDRLLDNPDRSVLHDIHQLRRDVTLLRRMLWPQREVVNALLRDGHHLVNDETRLYLRDCYDHAVQLIELLESFRDTLASMMEVYMSSISNRLNEVMRVLTIIATLFIPPTFIVGVYGMNFQNMPELHWEYGYVWAWLVIVITMGGMWLYFKRKDWL